jgi:hypothetical protein
LSFLKKRFYELRVERSQEQVVTKVGYDLELVFDQFMAEHFLEKIVTSHFQSYSTRQHRVIHIPANPKKFSVHVSVDDKIIRVDRVAFRAWAAKVGHSGGDIIRAMETHWGAVVGRRSLAAGTGMPRQTIAIDIPITGNLEAYIPNDPNGGTASVLVTPRPGAPPPNMPGVNAKGQAVV